MGSPQHIVLISTDLMVSSQLAGTAGKNHMGFRQISSLADYEIDETQPQIVIVDLSHVALESLPALVKTIKSNSAATQILAFGPHVHADRLQGAKTAGCDYVAHRGGVVERLGQLLRQ